MSSSKNFSCWFTAIRRSSWLSHLFSDIVPTFLSPSKTKTRKPTQLDETLKEDKESRIIFDKLSIYRTNKSKEKNVPPYVIFHTKTLIELANLKPNNITDLHKIYGLGTARIWEYGEDIINIISGNDCDEENGMVPLLT